LTKFGAGPILDRNLRKTEAPIKPDFFLVGAAKAGTTSLYHYLRAHPDIYLSPIKEPNHFATDIRPDRIRPALRRALDGNLDRFRKSDGHLHIHIALVTDRTEYLELFSAAGNARAAGECSVSYLPSAEAAGNIRQFNPDARIIMVLRDPIHRALSQYRMDRKIGSIDVDFETAVREDLAKTGPAWGEQRNYYWNGMYAGQVKRFLNLFPREQVKIILQEDLKANTRREVSDVFSFLGVDPDLDTSVDNTFNRAQEPRWGKLNRFLQKSGLKLVLKRLVPDRWMQKTLSVYYRDADPVEIPPVLYDELCALYRQDVAALSKLLNRDLSHWLTPRVN